MYLSLAFLLCLLPLLSAAPATSNTPAAVSDPGAAIASSFSASATPQRVSTDASIPPSQVQKGSSQAASTTHSSVHKPTVGTTKHHVVTPTAQPHTGGQITHGSIPTTRSFVPGPAPSHFHPRPPPQHHQSEATLVFEILGALAGVIFFLSVVRCIYSYNRTPSHDRITSILHRHQLQREMEELERNPPDHRRSLVEPPPPPYIAPPAYPDDESTPLSHPRRENVSYGEDPRTPPSAVRPNG
ncbi:hypothetical protein MVEN_01217900 [Mycena venus]|uniref:Transmembrane protein n=1 Tax=Mycena venus TaxID=2733690 RepID=A0A8H6Y505_9AGAR|nr:hypothetical protein MVEN_01217900 [Mycena venus]